MRLIPYLFAGFILSANPLWAYEAYQSGDLKVVYPRPGAVINASSTFIVGQTEAASNLKCNGEPVVVNAAGFFARVVPLAYGQNHFLLNTGSSNVDISVARKAPPKPISPDQLKMEEFHPNANMGVTVGDTINFSVRATPYSTVSVILGQRSINLLPAEPNSQSNNMGVAYGKVCKGGERNNCDLYKGSYRIVEADHFVGIHPQFRLNSQLGNLVEDSKISISTVDNLSTAKTIKDQTIVRLGPGMARTTPLDSGVKVVVDGWLGDSMRCLYAPNHHVWITKKELVLSPIWQEFSKKIIAPAVAVPEAVAQTINITEDNYGAKISLPLPERLPYQVEQKLNPNSLVLKVYGVMPDTDWITSEPDAQSKSNIDHVTWRQPEDGVYEITVHLTGKRQWGYKAYYEDNTLCLGVKKPVNTDGMIDLKGIRVCVDAGHGGSERGSIGCSGLPESELNFDIAEKLKSNLEALGATVIMTRIDNISNPGLNDRVRIAADNQADFLISVHNNALPDGRNPMTEHGTSSYWYHPQSIELANYLKNAVKKASGFPDLGARYQNLALVRGTAMPSVLLEIGFMINPDEFTCLLDPQFRSIVAQSIVEGLKAYLSVK